LISGDPSLWKEVCVIIISVESICGTVERYMSCMQILER